MQNNWHYNRKYDPVCSIEGCDKPHGSHGYCAMHASRISKFGDPNANSRWGKAKHPNYKVWDGMRQRCYNKDNHAYRLYGGRGIKICDRWYEDFDNFIEDMGTRPSKKHQIDRIDNDGDYEPNNCRWVLPAVNARNRSNNKLTKEKVIQIRKLLKTNITLEKIGERFGVSRTCIGHIKHNRRWANV